MVSFGTRVLGEDRLVGSYQGPPTEFAGGDYADFFVHLVAERERELERTGNFRTKRGPPESPIENCVIRTEYRPLYRIHSKAYFESGLTYPANWAPSERKRLRAERYSPFGTEGFYFGWTLKAAEDEARHYGNGSIDPEALMILELLCCFDDILYLTAGCLGDVWALAGLGPMPSLIDMYLAIMDPRTDNHATNTIGAWARERGLAGIVYPSARYGQEEWLRGPRNKGYTLIPAMNFVEMGSHLCRAPSAAAQHATHAVLEGIHRAGGLDYCIPVFAEPNLVLFDGSQIDGDRRGVIYRTYPLAAREEIPTDPRREARSFTYWASDEPPSWLPPRPGS